jgi:hypothetical protein
MEVKCCYFEDVSLLTEMNHQLIKDEKAESNKYENSKESDN